MSHIDSSLKKFAKVQTEVALIAAEFMHTNGLRIAAAAYWIEDQGMIDYDDWDFEAPYIIRRCCRNEIGDAVQEGLEEGMEIRHYRAYVTLSEMYGDNWPKEALRAHYRHVAKLDDPEEAAVEKWRAVELSYIAYKQKAALDRMLAYKNRIAKEAASAASQYEAALAEYEEAMAA